MKNTYGIIALILVIFVMIGNNPINHGSEYPATMQIIGLNYESDVVTLQTSTGFIYMMDGCEDYSLNDYVALIMNDNGTENITDDIIVKARYSGYYKSN